MQNAITFELSLDRTVLKRRVYGWLDLLGELGGLFGALSPLCLGLVRVFHYRSVYMYVTKEMFGSADSKLDLGK